MIPRGIGLLLRRELARLDRAPGRRRLVRGLSVAGLALVFTSFQGQGPSAPFFALAWAQLFLLSFMQPVRAAGIFVEGRLDGTLSLLALTPLRSWAIALGTCLAALALAAEGFFLSLPLFAIAAVYADLPALDIARVALTLFAAAFLTTTIGAAVGARGGSRAGSSAFLRSLVWVFFVFVLTLIGYLVAEEAKSAPPALKTLGRALFLPTGLMTSVPDGIYAPFVSFGLGFVYLVWASLRTSSAIHAEELARSGGGGGLLGFFGPRAPLGAPAPGPAKKPKARVPVPASGVVSWRESRRQGGEAGCIRPGFAAVALVVLLFGGGAAAAAVEGEGQMAGVMTLLLASTLWLLFVAWGLMGGARAYVEDREEGTLEILLTTPLYTPARLAREKLTGALLRGRWGIIGGSAVHLLGVVILGVAREAEPWVTAFNAASVLAIWVMGGFASLAIGQTFSLRAPNVARAQTWAAATAGILFFVGFFSICILLAIWLATADSVAPGVFNLVAAGALLIVALAFVAGLTERLTWRAL